MKKLKLQKFDDNFKDYYDTKDKCFIVYVGNRNFDGNIEPKLQIEDDESKIWNCWLFTAKYISTIDAYEVKYKKEAQKLKLYKVLDLGDYGNGDDLEKIQVMTEKDLRAEFDWALNNGKIPEQLIVDYQTDQDYTKENWHNMNSLSIGTIIDIMNDIYNYESGKGYYILETSIEIGE